MRRYRVHADMRGEYFVYDYAREREAYRSVHERNARDHAALLNHHNELDVYGACLTCGEEGTPGIMGAIACTSLALPGLPVGSSGKPCPSPVPVG